MINRKIKQANTAVATSSRFNYGDILYSLLADKVFPGISHVNLTGLIPDKVQGDIYGFDKVCSAKNIYLGGELFPKALSAQYKSESIYGFYKYRIAERLKLPIPRGLFVKSDRSISLSVGMQNIDMADKATIRELDRLEFLGVRDDTTFSKLKDHGLNPVIVPDFALITPDVYTFSDGKKDIAIFHFNESYLENYFDRAEAIVNWYTAEHKLVPVVQNMARCLNHDSNELSQRLAERVGGEFYEADSVEGITKRLSSCKLYVGNSFHGGIVASVYGAEIVWVSAHGNKLKNLAGFYNVPYISENPDRLPLPGKVAESFIVEAHNGVEHAKKFLSS
ncbi:polysaccharide pyruvyl transferase family protein [uncultured Thalassolituus sp.]|uniref:polysaccharide pyruvyl transferase family protein n=1 Tax=uncultured Thalassolituus sp. TaxID=285273 RepID=UPI002611274E|nr:polysaccharide pyruvyl transferase family protein [uncultured Thalassolituus sp.]